MNNGINSWLIQTFGQNYNYFISVAYITLSVRLHTISVFNNMSFKLMIFTTNNKYFWCAFKPTLENRPEFVMLKHIETFLDILNVTYFYYKTAISLLSIFYLAWTSCHLHTSVFERERNRITWLKQLTLHLPLAATVISLYASVVGRMKPNNRFNSLNIQ